MTDLQPYDLKGRCPRASPSEPNATGATSATSRTTCACVAASTTTSAGSWTISTSSGLTDDTVVIYTSDQGFFLGDHGWFDKRFMYEESLRMPFVVRYPPEIVPAGTSCDELVLNVDFARRSSTTPGCPRPSGCRAAACCRCCAASGPADWRDSMYYRYFVHLDVRTTSTPTTASAPHPQADLLLRATARAGGRVGETREPEWELFDLERDPDELRNRYDDPEYVPVVRDLTERLTVLQLRYRDTPEHVR